MLARRAAFLLLVSSVEACGLALVGSGPSGGPDAATVDDDPLPDATGAANTELDANASTNAGDANAAAALARNCAELLDASPTRKTGLYDIVPLPKGDTLHVYCDLETDRGGWTLVGRSGRFEGGAPPFGWGSATGAVSDLAKPYSLDVIDAHLVFKEVLVGDRDPAAAGLRSRAYKFSVAADFLTAHRDTAVATGATPTVLGDCKPAGGPSMLGYAGAASLKDVFWLRDNTTTTSHYGLKAGGFDLNYDDCMRGAVLDGTQGVIFVR